VIRPHLTLSASASAFASMRAFRLPTLLVVENHTRLRVHDVTPPNEVDLVIRLISG
jgi:hypothetical protein